MLEYNELVEGSSWVSRVAIFMLGIFNQDECYVLCLKLGLITLVLDASLLNIKRVK